MTGNGQPPNPQPLRQRVDPRRVAQLEQQSALQAQLLVARALSDVSNFTNALHHLTEQAEAGQPQARQVLQLFLQNLDAARAAAAGITVVKAP